MLHALQSWLRGLVVTAVILGFAELILPEGEMRRFARLALGLLVILVLLQPTISLLQGGWDLDRILTAPAQVSSRSVEADASRATAAGLAALAGIRRREAERSVRDLCRMLGAMPARIEAIDDARGGLSIRVRLEGAGDPERLRQAIANHLALPIAAVEVDLQ